MRKGRATVLLHIMKEQQIPITRHIDEILRATRTPEADVALSLSNQRALVADRHGRERPVKRMIYHVKLDAAENRLTGSILQRTGEDRWLPYVYNFNKNMWQLDRRKKSSQQ